MSTCAMQQGTLSKSLPPLNPHFRTQKRQDLLPCRLYTCGSFRGNSTLNSACIDHTASNFAPLHLSQRRSEGGVTRANRSRRFVRRGAYICSSSDEKAGSFGASEPPATAGGGGSSSPENKRGGGGRLPVPALAALAVAAGLVLLLPAWARATAVGTGRAASALVSNEAFAALVSAITLSVTWGEGILTATGAALKSIAEIKMVASVASGLVAGCLHTLTGPDHLAALAPLSIGRSRLQAAGMGALWGVGHDAGQLVFGMLFLLLRGRLQIPLHALESWGSRLVALTLLAIGALGLKEAQSLPQPCVGEECAVAEVAAANGNAGVATASVAKTFGLTTFFTGIVHGLQPDALLILLPALALPTASEGAAFLASFLLGTIAAMAGFTAALGAGSEALARRAPALAQRLSLVAALVAIAVGGAILVPDLLQGVGPLLPLHGSH